MKKKRPKLSKHAFTTAIFLILSPSLSIDFRQSSSIAMDGSHLSSIELSLKRSAADQRGLLAK
ncbi:hypothetical protein JFU48_10645 [Pseudomonas sp. TH49]|uniref:Uncharacterized protein n=1 Tax=Pseudomonas fluorescens R124 TaxID=743713 RepID=A0A7U9CX50_PSEFL|nr:hypothetical protein [Pseudomonas sp. TH49]EJZ60246.1 hypothetical protein I1A_004606 [Pseudomonas fluorescens R124]MBK5341847.1 hypothetical protein [Pseudomonas sp. TH49]